MILRASLRQFATVRINFTSTIGCVLLNCTPTLLPNSNLRENVHAISSINILDNNRIVVASRNGTNTSSNIFVDITGPFALSKNLLIAWDSLLSCEVYWKKKDILMIGYLAMVKVCESRLYMLYYNANTSLWAFFSRIDYSYFVEASHHLFGVESRWYWLE